MKNKRESEDCCSCCEKDDSCCGQADEGKGKSRRGQAAIGKPAVSARRGQAAMEYLMTYGWAILVLVIVLALLAYFVPRFIQPQELCSFNQGFTCSQHAIINQGGQVKVAFNLQNSLGQTINVSKILCTTAAPADADISFATDVPADKQIISSGASKPMNETICKDKAGTPLTLAPNSGFQGTLVVYYNYENDVITAKRTSSAALSGTVLKG